MPNIINKEQREGKKRKRKMIMVSAVRHFWTNYLSSFFILSVFTQCVTRIFPLFEKNAAETISSNYERCDVLWNIVARNNVFEAILSLFLSCRNRILMTKFISFLISQREFPSILKSMLVVVKSLTVYWVTHCSCINMKHKSFHGCRKLCICTLLNICIQ